MSLSYTVAKYWLKIADLNLPHLYLEPPLRVTSLEFRRDLWRPRKLESLGYRTAFFVVLIQYRRVTDGRTDGQTHDDSICRTSIASCGKNTNF